MARSSPLLKGLGKDLLAVMNSGEEGEAKIAMELIVKHQSKFPKRLQNAISINDATNKKALSPETFLADLYEATRVYFFDIIHQLPLDSEKYRTTNSHHPPLYWWQDASRYKHIEQKAEVALRCFPKLVQSQRNQNFSSYPIYKLLKCPQTLFFVPLFTELSIEMDRFQLEERGGVACFMANVILQLVSNEQMISLRDDDKSSRDFDDASSATLLRLKERGLMKQQDILRLGLVPMLLLRSLNKGALPTRARFRFLIKWDPSILNDCGKTPPDLLSYYLRRLVESMAYSLHCPLPNRDCKTLLEDVFETCPPRRSIPPLVIRCLPPDAEQRFRDIVELGMIHYPEQLGFVFHSYGVGKNTAFRVACDVFGKTNIEKLVNDELTKVLERNNIHENKVLRSLVQQHYEVVFGDKGSNSQCPQRLLMLAAAIQSEISLDGLYTVVRRYPSALSQVSTACCY